MRCFPDSTAGRRAGTARRVAEYRLARPAEAQIHAILAWSQERFGDQVRERYAALLVKAMEDVAADPERISVSWKRLGRMEVGLYHIGHSREHVGAWPGRVGRPRHYLVFRVGQDRIVDILGFIHERMLLGRALRRIVGADREMS